MFLRRFAWSVLVVLMATPTALADLVLHRCAETQGLGCACAPVVRPALKKRRSCCHSPPESPDRVSREPCCDIERHEAVAITGAVPESSRLIAPGAIASDGTTSPAPQASLRPAEAEIGWARGPPPWGRSHNARLSKWSVLLI